MIGSCILEHRSNDSFDIVTSMGMPTSSIYMSHIYCISPIDGNQINTKPKATMPQPRKHHLSTANPMMSVGHMLSSCPHTLGGNLLTQKVPHTALNGLHHPRTPSHNTHFTSQDLPWPSIWPPHLQKSPRMKKRAKTPQKEPKIAPRELKPSKKG